MPLFYLSFCDTERPVGSQFLGATIVEADDECGAVPRATALGTNPGGEVAVFALSRLPDEGAAYLNRFVPRKEVMSAAYMSIDELDEEGEAPVAAVCQNHNPVICL